MADGQLEDADAARRGDRRAPRPGTAPTDSTTAGTVNAVPLDTGATGYASAVQRLCQIPGGGPDSVRAVIGEIGLDMAVFGTHQRLCSWAKTSPRTVESGRKKGRARTGKGNPYLKPALDQMAPVRPRPTPSSASATGG